MRFSLNVYPMSVANPFSYGPRPFEWMNREGVGWVGLAGGGHGCSARDIRFQAPVKFQGCRTSFLP